jgi:hypothetical protein
MSYLIASEARKALYTLIDLSVASNKKLSDSLIKGSTSYEACIHAELIYNIVFFMKLMKIKNGLRY